MIPFQGPSVNGLYSIPSNLSHDLSSAPVAHVGTKTSSTLWHNRLGHPHTSVLNIIIRLLSLPRSSSTSSPCEHCLYEKKCISFLFPFHYYVLYPLDLLHTDVWGPTPEVSITTFLLLTTILNILGCIPSILNLLWPMFLKPSNLWLKINSILKSKFSALMEVVSFSITRLTPFLVIMIFFIKSIVPTHHNKMVLLKENRHVIETVITLMFHASIPIKFWHFAFATTVLIINRLPSPNLGNKSPYELLFPKRPMISLFLKPLVVLVSLFLSLTLPINLSLSQHNVSFLVID